MKYMSDDISSGVVSSVGSGIAEHEINESNCKVIIRLNIATY